MEHVDYTLVEADSKYRKSWNVLVDGMRAGTIEKVKDGEWHYSAAHRFPGSYSSYYGTTRTKKDAASSVADHEVAVREARARATIAAELHMGTMRKSVENLLAGLEGDVCDGDPGTLDDMIAALSNGIDELQIVLDEARRIAKRARGL